MSDGGSSCSCQIYGFARSRHPGGPFLIMLSRDQPLQSFDYHTRRSHASGDTAEPLTREATARTRGRISSIGQTIQKNREFIKASARQVAQCERMAENVTSRSLLLWNDWVSVWLGQGGYGQYVTPRRRRW